MEYLPSGPVTQSLSLPNDSFKHIPQFCTRKVWRSQGSRELCWWVPRRLELIEKENCINLSTFSCRNRKGKKNTNYSLRKLNILWIENFRNDLASVAQLVGCQPMHQKVAGSIASQACPNWGLNPSVGACRR